MKKSQIVKLKNKLKSLLIIVLGAFVVIPFILMIFNRSPKTYEGMYSDVTAPSYSFEFRNNTDDADVSDSINSLIASPKDGAVSDTTGMTFDGTTAYVDVPDLTLGGGPMTFEFYAQWNSLNSWSRIMDFANGESNDNILIANDNVTNTFVFSDYNGATINNSITIADPNGVTLNSLDHWVITWDDTTVIIYKNGVEVNNSTVSGNLTSRTTTNNFFGKSNWSSNGYFDGSIAYVRIWNGTALTSDDVTNLYSQKETKNLFVTVQTPDTSTPSGEDTTGPSGESCGESIRCVANNGTKEGEPLCCGQSGVVNDIAYNCPVDLPYCVGYTCGGEWGECVAEDPDSSSTSSSSSSSS